MNCDKCGVVCETFISVGGYRCFWCRGCGRMVHVERVVNGEKEK